MASAVEDFVVPDAVRERNASLAAELKGKLILAPLTKGGNLPFRRLCAEFGAEVTMGEVCAQKNICGAVMSAIADSVVQMMAACENKLTSSLSHTFCRWRLPGNSSSELTSVTVLLMVIAC